VPEALFDRDGARYVPTEASRGPWSPDALHGGPVAALLAGVAEAEPSDEPLQPARFTVELLRPVPLAPLTVHTEITRPGRKVQLVEAALAHDDRAVAKATLLRIRTAPLPVPEGMPEVMPPPPTAGQPRPSWSDDDVVAFHNTGVEHSFVLGQLRTPGPATDWIRLAVPVVTGEAVTPFQRVAAAADFGNGISGIFDPARVTFVNPDLTVYLHRLPAGEWVCLEATTHAGPDGIALAESALYDEQGRIGRAAQTLLLDPAPRA
jgi:hypothetical protein